MVTEGNLGWPLNSTNIGTEYFKHCIYSPFSFLQNAVCFIILMYFVPVLFTFYIQGALKLKNNNSGAKRLRDTLGPYAELLEPTSHLVGNIFSCYRTNTELKCYVSRLCLEFKFWRQRHCRRSQFKVCFIGVVQTFANSVDLQLNTCNVLMPWPPVTAQ